MAVQDKNENTITEVKGDNSIKNAFDDHDADLYIKTGKTGGKRFLIKLNADAKRPTLIAMHL